MKVEVFVDGILYQTMELPAGPHLLQNFPIIQGLNNVKLRITNPIGLVQTISLNSFTSRIYFLNTKQSILLRRDFPITVSKDSITTINFTSRL